MFNQQEEQDYEGFIRKALEQLITNLEKKGIKVDTKVIKITGDQGKNKEEIIRNAKEEDIRNAIKSAFQKLGDITKIADPKTSLKEDGEKCFCPLCFNFDTFEEVLKESGGEFAYTSVTLLGKVFDIKFHRSPKGEERIMIQPQELKIEGNISMEDLEKELNKSVQQKDFQKAQAILTEINKLKNK